MSKKQNPTKSSLISLETALSLSIKENEKNHKEYINPELVRMLKLLNFRRKFVRAQNCYVWDSEGERYLDFLGAYGAMNLGHNDPDILRALEKTAEYPNILQVALNPITGALAHNLSLITPGDLKISFFGNSGAEAVEGALKLARASTGKEKIVSCLGSFHGKSFGALSVTGREKYRKPFKPLVPKVQFIPYDDLNALQKALKHKDVAAFIVEPVQGEGGIIVPRKGYLKGAQEICNKTKTLLIIDEIQTGFGRTGKVFASEHEDVSPDIMCMAKSLGGGVMPISAFITTEKIWNKAYGSMEKGLLHTSTFGGNCKAATASLAAIDILLRDNLSQQAEEKGAYFLEHLRIMKKKYPIIKDVRGQGLFIGVEFNASKSTRITGKLDKLRTTLAVRYLGALVAGELFNKHKIITAYTLNNPTVIRIEPPLRVSYEQIDIFLAALEDICKNNQGMLDVTLSSIISRISSKAQRNK